MAGVKQTFDDIEKNIDSILHSLPLFRLPLNIALLDCLTVYERYMFEIGYIRDIVSHDAAMVKIKASIQTLVPETYRRCLSPIKDNYPRKTARELNTAQQAFVFCNRYSDFEHCFTLCHYGWFQGSVEDNVIAFTYPPDLDFGVAQLNRRLHIYNEERIIGRSLKAGLLPPSVSSGTYRRKLREAVQKGSKSILHSIPDDVYRGTREIAEATFPAPTIDLATQIGSYNLGEYFQFWLEFATLMLAQYVSCMERCEVEDANRVLMESVLSFTIDELADLINQRLGMSPNNVKNMICDLILNTNVKRPDVLIQPLVPLPSGEILVAPSLIYTANWELCLMRNWIQRYPDIYGRLIAQKKNKLADEVGGLFDPSRFMVSTRRKLHDEKNTEVGDVDVAVFDSCDGGLALFEVKWILEADSARESKKAEDQIIKGINQVLVNKSRFESDPQDFLKQVFPQRQIDSSDIKYVTVAVVANGDIGGNESQKSSVPVFDYYVTRDILKNQGGLSIQDIISSITEKHKTFADEINKMACVLYVKAGGYLLKAPGYSEVKPEYPSETDQRLRIGKTHPCICGSGRKYKDCCKRIEQYPDNALY